MIRSATSSDLKEIRHLTEACAVAMQEKGIYQWNQFILQEKNFSVILKERSFTYGGRARILGIIVLIPEMDEEYRPISWLTSNYNNLSIHRLATHPAVWGTATARN